MTRDGYSEVQVGMSAHEIESKFGKPYSIISKVGDQEIYEYIERLTMGTQVVEQRRYYIVIAGGKVIGKYMKVSNPSPFEAIYSDEPYPDS